MSEEVDRGMVLMGEEVGRQYFSPRKEASGGKAASGSKVGRVCIYRCPLLR